jgi:hypothetical protein
MKCLRNVRFVDNSLKTLDSSWNCWILLPPCLMFFFSIRVGCFNFEFSWCLVIKDGFWLDVFLCNFA